MSDKYEMSPEELENINAELFNSFDPEQELWIIGGSTKQTSTTVLTYSSNGTVDFMMDYDIQW